MPHEFVTDERVDIRVLQRRGKSMTKRLGAVTKGISTMAVTP